MNGFVIAIVIVLIVGIIIFAREKPSSKKTREESLKELAKYCEAELESFGEEKKNYRIRFLYEGQKFVFEDVEESGFAGSVNKAFLKGETSSRFNLSFTQKDIKASIRSNVILASDIPDELIKEKKKVLMPPALKDLKASSNNVDLSNDLLGNDKIARIFAEVKNKDSRGHPSLSLKVMDGIVILEFHAVNRFNPSLTSLRSEIASIEKYLNKLLVIIKAVNRQKL